MKAGSEVCSKADFDLGNANEADLIFGVLATNIDKSQIKKKRIETTSLMQLSELTFLMKDLSTSTLLNSKNFILSLSIII